MTRRPQPGAESALPAPVALGPNTALQGIPLKVDVLAVAEEQDLIVAKDSPFKQITCRTGQSNHSTFQHIAALCNLQSEPGILFDQ